LHYSFPMAHELRSYQGNPTGQSAKLVAPLKQICEQGNPICIAERSRLRIDDCAFGSFPMTESKGSVKYVSDNDCMFGNKYSKRRSSEAVNLLSCNDLLKGTSGSDNTSGISRVEPLYTISTVFKPGSKARSARSSSSSETVSPNEILRRCTLRM
jgi:hypothetical protein